MRINGWEIYFYKPLFAAQRQTLRSEVQALKAKLPPDQYRSHPRVKLYTAIMRIIKERIPEDPYNPAFALKGALAPFKRVKKMGLDSRHRLFFKVMRAEEKQAIFILWLGYPRKAGDKNDCYSVFTQIIADGEFPSDFQTLSDLSSEP